jgi:OmpA-OmpF porin, OOP family
MASKMQKLMLAAAALIVFQSISFAQTTTDWGWNWKDSSVVPTKKMPQYNEFLNNSFPYPPKPRNQWELGLSIGNSYVLGDRSVWTRGYNGGITGSITFRKALGHVISIRPGYTGSIIHIPGTGVLGAVNQLHAWNYAHIIGTDLLFSLNSLSYYRANPKTDWYVLGGYSLVATKVLTSRGDGSRHILYYPQSNTLTTFGGNTVNGRKGWALIQAYNVGFGMSYKLSNKINIGAEQKFVIPVFNNDYLDGYAIGGNKDIFSFSTLHVNINL